MMKQEKAPVRTEPILASECAKYLWRNDFHREILSQTGVG